MDRAEAYETLITEMEKLPDNPQSCLEELVLKPIEKEMMSNSGKRYSISIAAEKTKLDTFKLKGSIHDNNPYKFELVEESIIVKIPS